MYRIQNTTAGAPKTGVDATRDKAGKQLGVVNENQQDRCMREATKKRKVMKSEEDVRLSIRFTYVCAKG